MELARFSIQYFLQLFHIFQPPPINFLHYEYLIKKKKNLNYITLKGHYYLLKKWVKINVWFKVSCKYLTSGTLFCCLSQSFLKSNESCSYHHPLIEQILFVPYSLSIVLQRILLPDTQVKIYISCISFSLFQIQ